MLELWHISVIGDSILASTALTPSQLIAQREAAGEAQVDLKLLGKSGLTPGSNISLTLALPSVYSMDFEKGQVELDGTNHTTQKMDDANQKNVLKCLSTVTEMITELDDILDETSQVCCLVICFRVVLYLIVLTDPSNCQSCLEVCVWSDRCECIHEASVNSFLEQTLLLGH